MGSSDAVWTGWSTDAVIGGNPRFRDEMIDKCHGYTVYGHLTPSLKWYFGITKKRPERRWGKGGNNYKSSPRFYNAILKYGWNNIYHHIVGTGYTKDEACLLEKELIAKYDTLHDGGYNCTAGGDGCCEREFSDEQRERMRLSHLGQHSHASKMVYCVETGMTFESGAEASRFLGLNHMAVPKAARGEKKTAGGYHWAFVGDRPHDLDSKPAKTRVVCVETGCVYESLREASREYGVSSPAIRYAVKNRNRTCCGFHWRPADAYDSDDLSVHLGEQMALPIG